ncbi:MAG: CRISPR system precrRNA processing endoribonuclease RAMP protein Cas6 [Chloroflexota bacterium]
MESSADLLSLVLSLRPLQMEVERELPRWWGRAALAMLLNLIRQQDDRLAQELHDTQGVQPFTASNLIGRFPQRRLDTNSTYNLRLTVLQPRLAAILLKGVQPGGGLVVGSQVELDYMPFTVEAAYTEAGQHPWAANGTYQELAARRLLTPTSPERSLALQFSSPVSFKSDGVMLPLPLPGLVFGSLLDKWNAFAAVVFPLEARQFAEKCLAVKRYRLYTRAVALKDEATRIGGVGEIVYTTLNYDRYWMSVMHTLADFAFYCGVGMSASMGMGQCRRLYGDGDHPVNEE